MKWQNTNILLLVQQIKKHKHKLQSMAPEEMHMSDKIVRKLFLMSITTCGQL